ncbi:MAG: hypothetical protein GY804_10925 [Alphaproteobacteria bacterium]|nr:hypothetical protein [Alphaproteobacteria bacterium]
MPRSRFHNSPVDLTKASYEDLYSLLLAGDYEKKNSKETAPDVLLVSVVVFMCLVFFNVMLGESTISYEVDSAPVTLLRGMRH